MKSLGQSQRKLNAEIQPERMYLEAATLRSHILNKYSTIFQNKQRKVPKP